MQRDGRLDRQLWETAVLFELRNALRSGDIWLADSRRYREVETTFAPVAAVRTCARLAVPFDTDTWLQSRTATLAQKLQSVGTAAVHGGLPGASLKDGVLHLDRLEKTMPDGADTLVLKLYGDMAPSASPTFCSRLIIGLASRKPSAICEPVHRAAIGLA